MTIRTLKVGQVIQDNDPRMNGRKLTITQVRVIDVVAADASGKERRYLAGRIFDDAKPRRSGFSVVREENPLTRDPDKG